MISSDSLSSYHVTLYSGLNQVKRSGSVVSVERDEEFTYLCGNKSVNFYVRMRLRHIVVVTARR